MKFRVSLEDFPIFCYQKKGNFFFSFLVLYIPDSAIFESICMPIKIVIDTLKFKWGKKRMAQKPKIRIDLEKRYLKEIHFPFRQISKDFNVDESFNQKLTLGTKGICLAMTTTISAKVTSVDRSVAI